MTLAVVLLFTAMWLTVMHEPDTPLAKAVWHLTVTRPIGWASRVRHGHVTLVFLLSVAALMIVCWIGREGAQLIAMSVPEIGLWSSTFEVTTYLDAALAAGFAASTLQVTAKLSDAKTWLSNMRQVVRPRQPRTPRRTVQRAKPANDDDGRQAYAA